MALAVSLHVLERTLNTTMQTLNKKTIGLLVCGLVLGFAHAATAATDEPNYRPFTISAEGGTTGLGGSASWRFSDNFGFRGGVNYFSYDTKNFSYTTGIPSGGTASDSIENQDFNVKLRLLSEPLALDFYPSEKSSFHFSFGVLINQNRFNATVKDSGIFDSTYIFNDVPFFQSSVGDINLEVKQQVLSPYLSVGTAFYFTKSKRWALSGELGVAYTGSPRVSLSTPNSIVDANEAILVPGGFTTYGESLRAEEAKIQKDAEKYKFYPIVKIGVSYSF